MICDFVYDEAEGILDEGIVPSMRWADVLDCWACRDCGAPQSDFAMVAALAGQDRVDESLLSPGSPAAPGLF